MRIFTPAMFGFGSDAEVDEAEQQHAVALSRYEAYLEQIRPVCPEDVQRFTRTSLHDAEIEDVTLNRRAGQFLVSLDMTKAYSAKPGRLQLDFRGVEAWSGPVPKGGDEWLYEELERLQPDKFRLTLIFWRRRAPKAARAKIASWCSSGLTLNQASASHG